MFKIEKEFEYKGYPCYCIMQNHAHRLGYVGVSKSNSLFEKTSTAIPPALDGGLRLTSYVKNDMM